MPGTVFDSAIKTQSFSESSKVTAVSAVQVASRHSVPLWSGHLFNKCCRYLRFNSHFLSYTSEMLSKKDVGGKGGFVSILSPLFRLHDCIKWREELRQRANGVNAPWPRRAVLQWTAVG